MTNTDNDAAGITVSAISGPTTEAGGTATFTVVLNSAADRGRDDRAELERRDGRHGQPGEPDVHDRQLERGADGDGDRRGRRRWTMATSAYTIVTAAGDEHRRDLQRRQRRRRGGDQHRQRRRRDHGDADGGPDDDEAARDGDVHGGAQHAADGGRDDRAELERHDGRHGRAGEPDLHDRELERGADGDGDRRRRRRWTTATSATRS